MHKVNVLVTGGAGFIGTHLVRRLLREGCTVAVLDNFNPQIHAGKQELASDLAGHVDLFRGDVRDRDLLRRALVNRDVVVHLAAETGTGQSMYEVVRYQEVNIGGTAALVESLINDSNSQIEKVVVASSRAIYGEGKYCCPQHGTVYPGPRGIDQLRQNQWEPVCPHCGTPCQPMATDETSPPSPLSFYGLTKYVQEQMTLMFARTRGASGYALRYQNVYGPGQSLSNPYTGILAIFSQLANEGSTIEIFEDGLESRDFVFIDDVVDATWRCIREEGQVVETFNVGSGKRTTVLEVAREVARILEAECKITVTGAYRHGDIRHNSADLRRIERTLGFEPRFSFREGLQIFLEWAATQEPSTLRYECSLNELRERGLLHG